jgi:hypothetical protein
MEWDEKKIGLAVLAAMIISMIGMASFGIGQNEKLIFLAIFSVTVSIAVLFFGEWFEREE